MNQPRAKGRRLDGMTFGFAHVSGLSMKCPGDDGNSHVFSPVAVHRTLGPCTAIRFGKTPVRPVRDHIAEKPSQRLGKLFPAPLERPPGWGNLLPGIAAPKVQAFCWLGHSRDI